VNRLLRPGGYLVISGPPVQWVKQEKEWTDLQKMAHTLCYELITVEGNTAIWKKPQEPSFSELKKYFCSDMNYDD
jgi:putative homogalacturonan methyltransferase